MFDPHSHLTGVLPYRVLGFVATGVGHQAGEQLLAAGDLRTDWIDPAEQVLRDHFGSGFQFDKRDLVTFLAHHEVARDSTVVKIKPTSFVQRDPLVYAAPLADQQLARNDELYVVELLFLVALLGSARTVAFDASDQARMAGGSLNYRAVLAFLQQLAATTFAAPLATLSSADIAGALRQLRPVATADRGPDSDVKWLGHGLQNAYTATPLTDFDTAYVWRGKLQLLDPTTRHFDLQARSTAWVTAHQGITYSEPSTSAKLITTGPKLARLDAAMQLAPSSGRPGTKARWLLQVPNPLLGTADRYKDYTSCQEQLEKALNTGHTVAGFSVLAPESTEYADVFPTRLAGLLTLVADKAATTPGRRCVVHLHVGEGSPVWTTGLVQPDDLQALITQKRAETAPLVAEDQRQQLEVAQHNLDIVIKSLDDNKAVMQHPNLRIRLGHVTHLTNDQGAALAAIRVGTTAGVWADVNLTSNIATGALWLDEPATELDLKRVNAGRRALGTLFQDHGIVALAANKVPFVLGTDAGGVEHNTLGTEFQLAQDIRPDYRQLAQQYASDHLEWADLKSLLAA